MHYREMICWSSSYLGDTCRSDYQCYPEHSSCQSGKCKCIAGYEELDTECVVELPHCELIPGTIEIDGKCVCEDADSVLITTNDNKKCVPVAFGGIRAPCLADIQCQLRMGDGALCLTSTGECSCDAGYHYLHGLCWHSAGNGEECNVDAECTALGEWDAYACVNNVCTCASGAKAKRPGVQPLCRRTATENEECESKLDCIEGFDCDNPTSESRGTYCYESTSHSVFNTSIDRISAAAGTRDECGDNEVLTPSGTQCVCQRGYFRPSSSAHCSPELGETCTVRALNDDIPNSLCRRSAKFPHVPPASDEDAAASTEVGVWSCIGGYVPGPDNRNCHEIQIFGGRCDHEIQCGHYGGSCIGNKCICAAEYVYIADRQRCWPKSGLDEACISDEVCFVNAAETVRCDFSGSTDDHPEGICVCKSGYHAVNGDCREDASSLGERCIDAIDCVFAERDVSVTCTNGQCACSEGYVQYNTTICIYEVTSKCELIPGAIEEKGECVCKDRDYVIDGSRSKCIKSVFEGVGGACEESAQCLQRMGQGAGCVGGACACLEGYHYLHGECWLTKGFGAACSHDAECYQFAESDAYACVEGSCACAADAAPRRAQPSPICRRNARAGEECESTLDCIEDLICDKPSVNALDSICQEASRLSSPDFNSTTSPASVPGSRRRWSLQREQLVAPAEGDARLACGPNEQLTPSHTACICQRGFYKATSTSGCVPELGEPCYVGDDPSIPHVEYASCRRSAKFPYASAEEGSDESSEPDGVWACMGGFVAVPNNRECEKTRQNTYNCQINAQCGYFGGICNGRSCSCEPKYHYVSDKFLCWPTKGLNEECVSDIDCSVSTANSVHCYIDDSPETEDPSEPEGLTVRTEGICRCKSGYHAVTGDCRKEAYKLTDSCEGAEDCLFAIDDPTISCVSKQCACVYGYFPFNETACQLGVSGKCSGTSECRNVANTVCLGGECTCRTGFVRGGSDKCLPIATEYGDECEENDQCSPLTPGQSSIYCNSVCSCWPNMHYRNSGCWSTKYLDQKCGHQSECIVENSVCRNNYCTCDYGYVEDGSNGCVSSSPVSVVVGSVFSLILVAIASRIL